jgi:hypothetical protein
MKHIKKFEAFGDIFKSKETLGKEKNIKELEEQMNSFREFMSSIRSTFNKSFKEYTLNNMDYITLTSSVNNLKFDNDRSKVSYSLKNVSEASKVFRFAKSILQQVSDKNFYLQNSIFNYNKWDKKDDEKGRETFAKDIQKFRNFIENVRTFLNLCQELGEKINNIDRTRWILSLKQELSEKVEEAIKSQASLSEDLAENKDESLYIWNWIKDRKEPTPISGAISK